MNPIPLRLLLSYCYYMSLFYVKSYQFLTLPKNYIINIIFILLFIILNSLCVFDISPNRYIFYNFVKVSACFYFNITIEIRSLLIFTIMAVNCLLQDVLCSSLLSLRWRSFFLSKSAVFSFTKSIWRHTPYRVTWLLRHNWYLATYLGTFFKRQQHFLKRPRSFFHFY